MIWLIIGLWIIVSVLQPVSFVAARYRHVSGINSSVDFDPRFGISGFEKYKNIHFDFGNQDFGDCTIGKYMGPANESETIDCRIECDDRSGKEYTYQFFPHRSTMFGRSFKGGYCFPSRITQCNENIATTIWQSGYLGCVPKYPNIVDVNNKIVACNGRLRDNLTKITHEFYLAPDTIVSDLNNERLVNGMYRFECAPQKDSLNNAMIPLPVASDRFELVQNPCSILIPSSDPARVTYQQNLECACKAPYTNLDALDPKTTCTACANKYNPLLSTIQLNRNVYNTSFVLNEHSNGVFLMPPGYSSLLNNTTCEKAEISLSDSYSSQTLSQI